MVDGCCPYVRVCCEVLNNSFASYISCCISNVFIYLLIRSHYVCAIVAMIATVVGLSGRSRLRAIVWAAVWSRSVRCIRHTWTYANKRWSRMQRRYIWATTTDRFTPAMAPFTSARARYVWSRTCSYTRYVLSSVLTTPPFIAEYEVYAWLFTRTYMFSHLWRVVASHGQPKTEYVHTFEHTSGARSLPACSGNN